MRNRPIAVSRALIALLLFSGAGCHHAPDGRQVFLQSEAAVDAVRSFRMHIETFGALPEITDAEFACDQDVIRYVTTQHMWNGPSLNVERVEIANYMFVRSLAPEVTDWSKTGRQRLPPDVCYRLKSPDVQHYLSWRLFSADDANSVPPFFAFASEQEATISHDGNETLDGIPCEIWTIREGNSVVNPAQTVWIAVGDHLPRKYLQGERDNPLAIVTYSSYGENPQIQLPPSAIGY